MQGHAPSLAEHPNEILAEAGYAPAKIAALRELGANRLSAGLRRSGVAAKIRPASGSRAPGA